MKTFVNCWLLSHESQSLVEFVSSCFCVFGLVPAGKREADPPALSLAHTALLLQIQNTFVQCFHQESSESRARDSVTALPQTLQSSSQRSVMGRWSTRVALLMLLIGQISAETSSSSNACQDQNALHDRMDAVEK
ncbi:hypothetical protein QQF64_006470, partial [Cirrhinus molitorella]